MRQPKAPWSLHVHSAVHSLVFSPHLQREIKCSPFWKAVKPSSGLHKDKNQPGNAGVVRVEVLMWIPVSGASSCAGGCRRRFL